VGETSIFPLHYQRFLGSHFLQAHGFSHFNNVHQNMVLNFDKSVYASVMSRQIDVAAKCPMLTAHMQAFDQ
jgi:hypothetical protein